MVLIGHFQRPRQYEGTQGSAGCDCNLCSHGQAETYNAACY